MDFSEDYFKTLGHGRYEPMDPGLLPPLYLAYREDLSQISGIYHSNLRQRWRQGDPKVVFAMEQLARLTEEGRRSLIERDYDKLAALINRNFDIRSELVELDPRNVEMVELARRQGVCAKYAGSGGAIVGICREEDRFHQLQQEFHRLGCKVIRPTIRQPSNNRE